MAQPNTAHELTLLDRYWRAANYLSSNRMAVREVVNLACKCGQGPVPNGVVVYI